MEQSNIISKSEKKNLIFKNYFKKNIFDEDFLDEKDKALSPIALSDVIPGESLRNSIKEKKEKGTNFSSIEEKDIKYSSNIVYIESKIDDNDEEPHVLINEEITRIIMQQRYCKNSLYRRMVRKKI